MTTIREILLEALESSKFGPELKKQKKPKCKNCFKMKQSNITGSLKACDITKKCSYQ